MVFWVKYINSDIEVGPGKNVSAKFVTQLCSARFAAFLLQHRLLNLA